MGLQLLFGRTLIHVGIALCTDWAMRFPKTRMGRFLNSPPLVWVGVASYSLCLWQQLFLCREHAAWYTTFPQNLGLAFATAAATYYLVEQPLQRAREVWWRSHRSVAAAGAAAPPREPEPGP